MHDNAYAITEADRQRLYRWLQNPYHFMIEGCWTRDEVEAGRVESESIKLIPPLPHLRVFADQWQQERLLAVVKSRRMLFTWAATALELWQCEFFREVHIAIVGMDQSSSEEFLGRHHWLWDHQANPKPAVKIWKGQKGNPQKILFEDSNSTIEAFPGDPDKLRGLGATRVRCEEIAFWKWPEESWRTLLPIIQGKGSIVVISTPLAGSFFERLVKDQMSASVR